MQQIDSLLHRKIKARLYLNAVLPAFEDLLAQSEQAREILGERAFTLTFQTSSGLKSSLTFGDQTCLFHKSGADRSNIVIHFLTEEHLNKEFEGKGFRLPIPIKGSTRIGDIKAFKALSALLEATLRPPTKEQLEDIDFHNMHVGIQLGIALRATVELATHEKLSRTIMKNTPEGIAYFSVGKDGYGAWLEWRHGRLISGEDLPATRADVSVQFTDADTALRSVGNHIDVMAAIGLGDITIEGLIPLADSLGYIFERIPLYITP